MEKSYARIFENVLFVLLLATMAGWVTAPAATDLHLASHAATSTRA